MKEYQMQIDGIGKIPVPEHVHKWVKDVKVSYEVKYCLKCGKRDYLIYQQEKW